MPNSLSALADRMQAIHNDLLEQENNRTPLPALSFEPSSQARPYMEQVQVAEEKYGLPKNLLARLLQQESGFNPQAVSPKGARGIAQIMPEYHPEAEPDDPAKAIDYAASYLRQNADRFGGDWEKAVAAYNAGPGTVERQGMDNLPAETQDYLQRITGRKAGGGQVDYAALADRLEAVNKRLSAPEPGFFESLVGDVAGGLVDLAEMYGRAGRALPGGEAAGADQGGIMSRAIKWAEDFRKAHPTLEHDPRRTGFSRWFHEGLRSAVTSIAAGAPGALAGMAGGSLIAPGPGTFIGGVVGFATGGGTLFGLSEYDDVLQQARKAGVPMETAEPAALRSAMYEGGFEFAADILEGLTLGSAKLVTTPAREGLKQGVASLFRTNVKQMLKRGAAFAAIETGSEMLTGALQTEELHRMGLTDQRFMDGAIDAFGPSLVASMIFFGLGEYGRRQVSNRIKNNLKDPQAAPEKRMAAVQAVQEAIAPASQPVADAWADVATRAVAAGEPIDLDAPIATDEQLDARIQADEDLADRAAQAATEEYSRPVEQDVADHDASRAVDPLGDDALAQDIIDKVAFGQPVRMAPVATTPRGEGAEEMLAAMQGKAEAPQPVEEEPKPYELPPARGGARGRIEDYAKWFRANHDMGKRSNAARADDLDYFVDRMSLGRVPMRMARVIKGKGVAWGDEKMDRVMDMHEPVRRAMADQYGMGVINKAYEDTGYIKARRAKEKAQTELHQKARELLTPDEYRKISMTSVLGHYFDPEKKERPTTYGIARKLNTTADEVREAIDLVKEFAGEGSLFVGDRGVIDGNMFDSDGYDMYRVFQGVVDKRGQAIPETGAAPAAEGPKPKRSNIPPGGSRQSAIEYDYFLAYEGAKEYPGTDHKNLVALQVYDKPGDAGKMLDVWFATRDNVDTIREEAARQYPDATITLNYDLTPYRPKKGEISYQEYAAQRDQGVDSPEMMKTAAAPQTKREKALAEYNDLVASLTDEQRQTLGDLIKETPPENPASLTHQIRKRLAVAATKETPSEFDFIGASAQQLAEKYVADYGADKAVEMIMYDKGADERLNRGATQRPKYQEAIEYLASTQVETPTPPAAEPQARPEGPPTDVSSLSDDQLLWIAHTIGIYRDRKSIDNDAFRQELVDIAQSTIDQKAPILWHMMPGAGERPSKGEEAANATWWDKELTPYGRREAMQKAGIELPDRVLWANIKDEHKQKLLQVKQETPTTPQAGLHANQLAATDLVKDTSTKKGILASHGVKLYDDTIAASAAIEAIGPRGAKETIGQYLAKLRKHQKQERVSARTANIQLKGDYGVEHIDAYSDAGEKAKNALKNDARRYLLSVNQALGYTPDVTKQSKVGVTYNAGGIGVGGDTTGIFWKPGSNYGVYVDINHAVVPGAKASPSGVSIMWRVTTKEKKFTGRENKWEDWDINAADLAKKMRAEVDRVQAADKTKAATRKEKPPAEPEAWSRDQWERVPGGAYRSAFGNYLISGEQGAFRLTDESTGRQVGGTYTDRDTAAARAVEDYKRQTREAPAGGAQKGTVADQIATMSMEDIDRILDEEEAALTEVKAPEKAPKAERPAPKAPKAPTAPKAPQVPRPKPAPETRSATEIAKSAAEHGVKGISESIKGLYDLFGGAALKSLPGGIDEETYAKAKPHFEAALKEFQAAGKDIREFVRWAYENFSAAIKPYLRRFIGEKKEGAEQTLTPGKEADILKEKEGLTHEPVPGESGISAESGLLGDREAVEGEPGAVGPGGPRGPGPGDRVREGAEGEGGRPAGAQGVREPLHRPHGRPGPGEPGRGPLRPGERVGPGAGGETAGGSEGPAEANLAPEDRNHVIAPDDVIAPPGVEGKINANIRAIDLLKQLEQADRNPTPEEKKILAQYVGWGAFSQKIFNQQYHRYLTKDADIPAERYFDDDELKKFNQWKEKYGKRLHPALGGLLTEEEWKSGAASTINAHFTSKEVVNNMWTLAKRLGFKGGTVLEPAAGVGNFFGLMPQDMADQSALFGIEKDTISGNILKRLYPQAHIEVGPFERSRMVLDNSIDLTITNVPFGKISITDKRHPDYDGWKIHNYFLARSLDATKPGGLMLAISSAWSLDAKSNGKMREYLTGKADLVGAMRLPNTAFKANAGTEVVTDILVFRKKDSGGISYGADFRLTDYLDTKEFRQAQANLKEAQENLQAVEASRPPRSAKKTDKKEFKNRLLTAQNAHRQAMNAYRSSYTINEYYKDHPEMVLGKNSMTGSMYAKETYTVEPTGDLNTQLAEALESFPEKIAGQGADISKMEKVELAGLGSKEGTLVFKDGVPRLVENGRLVPPSYINTKGDTVQATPAQVKRIKDYMAVRDLTAETIAAMGEEATTDDQVKDYQARLNKAYDAFVKKHGTFNGSPGNSFLAKMDNDFALVDALELQIGEGKETEWIKAPIFTQRTVFPFVEPSKADSIEDAVNLSMIYRGEVSLPYISDLMGEANLDTLKAELVEKGLGFVNPDTGMVEQTDLYLSGNVKKKLARAKLAAENDPSFEDNIKALEKVIPEDIGIEFITFRLGSSWLPSPAIADFLREMIEVQADVTLHETDTTYHWVVDPGQGWNGVKNRQTYASGALRATELIESALNLRRPKVMVPNEDGKGTHEDKEASKEAALKIDELSDTFVTWAKGHERWAQELATKYNEEKNGTVLRKHSVPKIDVYPNASPVDAKGNPLRLRDHQKIAVSRSLQESVLLAYGVGTGKTFILITSAMEMKRIGTARKPLIVVHNQTIDQYRNSFKLLYPGAKVLIPADTQRNAKQRKKLLISMSTGDWDAIVLPQSFFDGIANDPAREQAFVDEQIAQLEDALAEAEREEGRDSFTVKDLQTLIENRLQRLQRLLDRRQDEVLTFEKMGIDALLVDEVHAYKRSEFYTKLNRVKGIDNGASQRSTSLILKSEFVREKTGGKNVITATGTPISNTLAELWTMLRYVRPDLLDDYGVRRFDDFATAFGVVEEDTEQTASGFKDVERFKRYTNGPELLSMFFSGADVRLTKDADLKLPKIKNSEPTKVVNEKSPELTLFIRDIIDQWRAWENLTGREKMKNRHVPIVLYGLAKKAAVDLRLIDPDYYPDDPNSKVNNCVRETLRIYNESNDIQGTQIIFCDLIRDRARNPRIDLHEDIKAKLIKGGIPADQIEIFKSGLSEAREEAIKKRIRTGESRVIIGTTGRLGVGVDIAEKIVAGHHLTVPDRPMDMEQRNGRFIRQSNKNEEVEVLQYATRDTLDAVMFQRLATKQKGADQVLTGSIDGRDFEDPYSTEQAEFAEFAAAASGRAGNLLFEKSRLKSQQHKYRIAEQAHIYKVSNARTNLNQLPERIERLEDQKERAEEFKAYVEAEKAFPDGRLDTLTIDGKTLPRKEVYEILNQRIEAQLAAWEKEFVGKPMGHFRKNAPVDSIYGPRLESYITGISAGKIELTVGMVGSTNFDKKEKPSTPLQWQQYTDRLTEEVKTRKVEQIAFSMRYKGRRLDTEFTSQANLGSSITRNFNDMLSKAVNEPGLLQAQIDQLNQEITEYENIVREPFRYRQELVDIQRRINEINTELTALTADELIGVEGDQFERRMAEAGAAAPSRLAGLFYPEKSYAEAHADVMRDLKNGIMRLLGKELKIVGTDFNEWKDLLQEAKDNPRDVVRVTREFMHRYDYEISEEVNATLDRLMTNAQQQINQAQMVAIIGEPLEPGIPEDLEEELGEYPKGVTRFALGAAPETNVQRRALDAQQVRNLQRLVDLVTTALSRAGISKELFDRIKLEFKPIIDLRGKNIEETVAQWVAQGQSINTILGATTFRGFKALMELSLEQDLATMERTAYHEAFHILANWVLPESEYAKLMKSFNGNEETTANAFADYMAGRGKPIGWVRRIFIKLRDLLRRVGNALRGAGFTVPQDIFGRLAGQAYAGQRPGEARTTIALMAEERPPKALSRFQIKETTNVFDEVLPPQVAAEIKAARGRDRQPVKQQITQWLKTLVATFTPGQMYPEMPDKFFAKENEILRRFVQVASWSKTQAIEDLKEILNPKKLGPTGYDLFNLKIVLDDILYDVETEGRPLYNWEERHGKLPFEFANADQLRESLALIDQRVAANPEVAVALQRRRKIMRDLRTDLVSEGLLPRSVLADDRYFHHEVLKYANLQAMAGVGTGSRDVRTHKKGWQIYRTGSLKKYNSQYFQSEFKVLAQGYAQLETKRILDELDASSNIIRELRDQARHQNYVAVVGGPQNWQRLEQLRNQVAYLRGDGGYLDSDTRAQVKALTDEIWELDPTMPFRQKIAIGMSKLAKTGAPPGSRYNEEIDLDDMTFADISRMADEGEPGALMVLKAVNDRKAFIEEALGENHLTWEKLMEEREPREGSQGWAVWFPKPGQAWYLTNSMTDKVLEQVAAGLPIAEADIRKTWSRAPDLRWVVPVELKKVLDGREFLKLQHENVAAAAAETTLNWWKRWILINPFRLFKYNFNNLSGDFDITLAYAPSINKWAKGAAKDLWAFHYDKPMDRATKDQLMLGIKNAAIDSGMTIHDIPDIDDMAQFDQLMSAMRADKLRVIDYIKRFWQGSKTFTTWRENVLRLAAYRYFLDEIEKGNNPYGASNPFKVDAVDDKYKKAALLARELIGDYGGLSKGGQWLRRKMIPFYSWNEINAPRYWRLFKNLPLEGEPKGRRLRMGGVLAKKAGVTLSKMALFYAMVQMFNHLVWPEEEEELGDTGRRQQHLILGRRADGSIITVRMQGALSDALSWIGAEDIPQDLADVRKGRKSWWQLLTEVPVSVANRLVQGIRPDIKVPAELITGRQVFPDVTKPRPIRDRYEHLARMFSLEPIYRHLAGRPVREGSVAGRVMEDLGATIASRTDPGEAAFHQTKTMVFEFLEKNNIERPPTDPTNRSNALYYYRKAIQLGDTKAALHYLQRYKELGGSPAGVKISIKRQHPLSGLPAKYRLRFMASLSPEDRMVVRRAIQWYRKVYH